MIMDEVVDETNEKCTTSDDYASKVRELDKELQAALKEFTSQPEQTEKIKMEFFRKRNALYSQRKYYRMKYGFAYLSKKKRKLQKSNEELKAEHKRLKTLISIANSVVESASVPQNNVPDKGTGLRKSMPDNAAPKPKQLHCLPMKRRRDAHGKNVIDCGEVPSTKKIENQLFSQRGNPNMFSQAQVLPPILPATTPLARNTGAGMSMGKIMNDQSWPARVSPFQERMPCTAKTSDNMIMQSNSETVFSDFCLPNNGVVQQSRDRRSPILVVRRPFTTCWNSSSPVLTPANRNSSSGMPSIRNLPIRGFVNPSGQVTMAVPDVMSRSFNHSNHPTQLSLNIHQGPSTTVHPVTVMSRANHQRSILDASAMNSVSPSLGNSDVQCRIENIRRLQQTLNQEIDSLSNMPELSTPVTSSMNVDCVIDHNSQARIIGSGQFLSRQLLSSSRPTRPDGGFVGNSLMQHRSYPVTIGVLPNVVEETRSSHSSIPLYCYQQ